MIYLYLALAALAGFLSAIAAALIYFAVLPEPDHSYLDWDYDWLDDDGEYDNVFPIRKATPEP